MIKKSENFKNFEAYIGELQNSICNKLEEIDCTEFHNDVWRRPGGGGGLTRVIQGKIFEKGGVNTSSVSGNLPDNVATHLKVKPQQFAAAGISLVIHPHSPRIPTIHMNLRKFEMEDGTSWFGGGIDLTPYYPHIEDFEHFHRVMKKSCYDGIQSHYDQYKVECDKYFTIPHRKEMRGIGGIFFDYLKTDLDKTYQLIQNVGNHFLESYVPIVEQRKIEPFAEDDKKFQYIRRGRYVEFNLIYDRGTLFGLRTAGRIESILMSLPPVVHYDYDWSPPKGSAQAEMLKYYQPHSWV